MDSELHQIIKLTHINSKAILFYKHVPINYPIQIKITVIVLDAKNIMTLTYYNVQIVKIIIHLKITNVLLLTISLQIKLILQI